MENEKRSRGRPRSFDRNEALAAAALQFWRLGYEGASIADLTAAMGITPQSLYSAFRSKADLYLETLDWYRRDMNLPVRTLLEEGPSAVATIGGLLRAYAQRYSRPDRPGGCMISTGGLALAEENRAVEQHMTGLRRAALAAYRDRLARAVAEGELKPETDPAALARFIATVIQGMSVQGHDGASTEELLAVAEIAVAELERHRTGG